MKTATRSGRPNLSHDGIESLDDAFYAASCFAGIAPDATVRIWCRTLIDGSEEYCIRHLDQTPDGNWMPCYEVKRCEEG